MSATDTKMIKSAHRVLELLEFLGKNQTATVMDVARALDYPQSSTSELLRCLVHLGYLSQDRSKRTYRPTARVPLLGAWVEPTLFRNGLLLPGLDSLAGATGQTVVLTNAFGYSAHTLHVIRGRGPQAVGQIPEQRSLIHSAAGRLLLGSFSDSKVKKALHRLNADEQDPERRVRIAEFVDQLASIRSRGYDIDLGESGAMPVEHGAVSMLVPRNVASQRLAVSITAPPETIESHRNAYAEALRLMFLGWTRTQSPRREADSIGASQERAI